MPPRVRQGIQFTEQDKANGELRVTGDAAAGMLLWAAQWLDEHREYIISVLWEPRGEIPLGHPAWQDAVMRYSVEVPNLGEFAAPGVFAEVTGK